MIKKTLILCLLALFTSCASITKEDCHELQWKEQGYEAGLTGSRQSAGFANYAARCSEFGISPKKELFNEGYKKGHARKCNIADTSIAYDRACNELNKNYANEYTLNVVRNLENKVQYLESENRRLQSDNLTLQTRLNTNNYSCGHSH